MVENCKLIFCLIKMLYIRCYKYVKIMKAINSILIMLVSWIISALILYPCLFLTLLSGFKIDYHHKFHLWWRDEVLDKCE